ncbi:MAG: hypothetical protein PHU81_07855 [Acidobacteriota bacterium]|nr:hypothetical protein [Acidobacteriota bacterium]
MKNQENPQVSTTRKSNMPSRKLKSFVIITVLIVLGITLMACHKGKSSLVVPEGAKEGDIALKPFVFKINSGNHNAESGSLIVPENWDKTTSRLIALPVIHIYAITDKPENYSSDRVNDSSLVIKELHVPIILKSS